MGFSLAIIGFVVGFLTDLAWTCWMKAIAAHRPIVSANWSIIVYIFSFIATWLVVEKNFVAIIMYLIGGYIGTILGVYLSKK